jgi:hypothetical protein
MESLSWLWILIGIIGSIAVIIGVWGEGWADGRVLPYLKQQRLIKWFWRILLLGLALDLVGIIGSAATSIALESRIEELRRSNNEHEAQLLSVSNSAAMNSPSNFPISSVRGFGRVFVNKKDALVVSGLNNKRAVLELIAEKQVFPWGGIPSGIPINGRIVDVLTNGTGHVSVMVAFDESNLRTIGGSPAVTFNNLGFVRLNLFPDGLWSTNFIFEAQEGWLRLSMNSQLDADFNFPKQTNGQAGIGGFREKDQ